MKWNSRGITTCSELLFGYRHLQPTQNVTRHLLSSRARSFGLCFYSLSWQPQKRYSELLTHPPAWGQYRGLIAVWVRWPKSLLLMASHWYPSSFSCTPSPCGTFGPFRACPNLHFLSCLSYDGGQGHHREVATGQGAPWLLPVGGQTSINEPAFYRCSSCFVVENLLNLIYRVQTMDKLYGNIQTNKRNSEGEYILMKILGKVYMHI